MNNQNLWTIIIISGVIILSIFILNRNTPDTPEEIAKCIGGHSVLYVQFGCHACETQKKMFGENYKYMDVIDCFFEGDRCSEIEATPTWDIDGKKYKGVQSIEKLKELTGCGGSE